jgi:glutamate-1-semialdehyde 2,1-aminomutase
MEQVSPAGPVYQAGTLSGNPLAMAGGLATLEILAEPEAYEKLERKSALLDDGLADAAKAAGVPLAINRVGSMLTPFFVKSPGQAVTNYAEATACDTAAYATFFHTMLEEGVHLAPSQYEAMFVGLAHKKEQIEETIRAAGVAFKAVAARTT